MTKKQWQSIKPGSRVWMKHTDLERQMDGNLMPKEIILRGEIIRVNSNHSQVIVKWDDKEPLMWYGRLSLELYPDLQF